MIKDFLRFIYEAKYDSFSEEVAKLIMQHISQTSSKFIKGRMNRTVDFNKELSFVLSISIIRSVKFNPNNRKKFKKVPWEKRNFQKYGFALDANSFIPTSPDIVEYNTIEPEIEINIVIDPEKEPNSHNDLYFKLLDCIRHEFEHLLQKGSNSQQLHSGPQVDKNRKDAEDSYLYFLLPDEVPAMVSGMRLSAIKRGVPIDIEFEEYLEPIKDSGFITTDEFDEVMNKWINFTIKHFPGTKISEKYKIR